MYEICLNCIYFVHSTDITDTKYTNTQSNTVFVQFDFTGLAAFEFILFLIFNL